MRLQHLVVFATLAISSVASATSGLLSSDSIRGARAHALAHLHSAGSSFDKRWGNARLSDRSPSVIHAPLSDGSISPFALEFDVLAEDGSPAGSIHVTNSGESGIENGGAYHVNFFRTVGESVAENMKARAKEQSGRNAHHLVMINPGMFAAEDGEGRVAAWPDVLISDANDENEWIASKTRSASKRVDHLYRTQRHALSRGSFLSSTSKYVSGKATGRETDKNIHPSEVVYAGGEDMRDFPDFGQIMVGDSTNTKKCASGCGPTAVAEIMAWHYYSPNWRMCFPRGSLPNPHSFSRWKSKIWTLHDLLNTWCVNKLPAVPSSNDNAATYPSDMKLADAYVRSLGGKARFRSDYSGVGWTTKSRMKKCDSAVRNGGPCIIGLGWLEHYALVTGIGKIGDKPYKYIENGYYDGSRYNGWVHADQTWFAGWLTC